MTSLAEQLKKLAVPQGRVAAAAKEKDHKSLLFDPREAAGLDRDTIFSIGVNGIQELETIDGTFEEFEGNLFSEGSKTMERSVQTKEVNKKLDKQIRSFLLRLSPYFTLKPAQKAMEWLIYRFGIHEYNIDDIMLCILPYHTTKLFVRVVQLFNISSPTHNWHWMHPIQESGVSLSREIVLHHCHRDPGFLQFVCNIVPLTVKAYKGRREGQVPHTESVLRLTFSFYVSTLIGAMELAPAIKEEFLAILIPFLTKGLKSSYKEYKAATYMIISQLCAKAFLDASLLHPLIESVCKKSDPFVEEDMISCLAVIYQTQDLKELENGAFQSLCGLPNLVPVLRTLHENKDISPLLQVLMQKMMQECLVSPEKSPDEMDVDEPVVEKGTIEALLGQLVTEITFGTKLSTSLIKHLMKCFMKTESQAWTAPFFSSLISNLEKKYPTSMDLVVQDYASKKLSESKERKLQIFMQMTMAGSKHQVLPEVETSLVLSLNHPSSDARELAVKRLLSLHQSGQVDIEFLQSSLALRIEDGDQKVVLAVLQFGDELFDVLSVTQLMTKVEKILARWHRRSKGLWPHVAKEIITLLTSKKLCEDEKDKDSAVAVILPYLLPSSSEKLPQDMAIIQQIASSHLARSHDLLKDISKVAKEKSSAENLRKLMSSMFEVLAENLSKYPVDRRFELVKTLVELYQDHHQKEAFGIILSILLTKLMKLLKAEERLPIAEHLLELLEMDMDKLQKVKIKELLKLKTSSQEHSWPGEGIPQEVVSCLGHLLVSKVSKSSKISPERLMGNLWCLEMMVTIIEIPEDITEENDWLDLNANSSLASDQYLLLLVKIFEKLTQGVTFAEDGHSGGYFKDILSLLVKEHFSNLRKFWSFLSMLCTAHCRLAGDKSYDVSYLLQVCCLQVANISFSAAGSILMEEVLQENSPVFPSLLVTLNHPSESVRKMAVQCLSTIQKGCSATTPYSQLLKHILKRKQEIIADGMYLPQALHLALSKAGSDYTKSPGKGNDGTQGSVDCLVGCISSDKTPYHVRCGLMEVLCLVDNEKLLSSLLPTLSKALETSSSSSDLAIKEYSFKLAESIVAHFKPSTATLLEDVDSRQGLWKSLTLEDVILEGRSLQGVALQQVTPAFFEALPSVSVQQELFKHLIDVGLDAKSPDTVKRISKTLRKLPLSSELIITELSDVLPDKHLKNLQDARQARKRKQQKKTDEKAAEVSEKSWQRATFILEHLQQRKLSKMENVTRLVPEFFMILSVCLESSSQEDNLEYVKQLLLTLIHSICDIMMKSVSEETDSTVGKLTEEQFNVELVVQCVRTSDNPQTHNHALLVLTIAAELFPEHLLHNVMSIFTFMGASVLRQDDGYSFQVINKTLQTVIPALMKASDEGALPQSLGESVHSIVFMIIRVFVDSFPHIPDHRKLPLFTQLIQAVDAERYLWSCIVLLVERFAMKGSAALYPEEALDPKGTGRIQQFWSSLCHHFTPQVQIVTITKILQLLSSLPEDKTDATTRTHTPKVKSKKIDATGYASLLDLSRYSGKHLRQLKFTMVGFFAHHLSGEEFISQVASLSEEETNHLQELYQMLLEENLRYAQQVAQSSENNADNTTAKFWKALLHRLYDVLDKVNALLPADVFIQVISGLLSNELASVRRKAMELLNNILTQNKNKFKEEECILLLGLVQQLTTVAEAGPDSMKPEVDINRQTALYSLKLLCKLLGPDSPRQFTQVVEVNLAILKQEQENIQLVSSSLLCVAEAISVLRAHSIPFLSRLVPLIIQMLSEFETGDSSNLHLLCTVTSTQKVMEVLPNFISPYVQDILHQVIRLSCNKDDEKTQLNLRLKSCRQTLSKKLPIRVLLPAVTQTYGVVQSTNPSSLVPLMAVLEDHISYSSKEDILSHHSNITAFFLEALDFRTKHPEVGLDETAALEKSIISAVLMQIMKLSENTFRPMYFKIFDWANHNEAPHSRLITFYHLSDAVADKLRSIFSLFAGHIVSSCSELLDRSNTAKAEEAFFTGDKGQKQGHLLIQLILSCLQKCFVYDRGAFANKERFEMLSQPLVDQLENDFNGDEAYQEMVSTHLAPCITAMMASVRDQGIWQPLNYQLLLKMRHSSAKVRFAALVVLDSIHEALKENYLSLLPETIPFLAELMEDESEEVEHKCQEIVRELEKTLGEPLQKHF